MMRYSIGIFLTALAIAATFSMPGFTLVTNQSLGADETAPRPRAAFEELEIAPRQAMPLVLGDAEGVAYFTSEPGGLRVVATIGTAGDPGRTPVRFVATLQPEQVAALSTPGKAGEQSIEVSFLRRGERLIVKVSSRAVN